MKTQATATATTEEKELTPYQMKRKKLRELSTLAKEIQEMGCEEMTINAIIIENFYTTPEHTEFQTLQGWNKKGYTVKKGETAFVVWGRPKATQNQAKTPEAVEDEENDFYPLCYLFSNAQIQPRVKK